MLIGWAPEVFWRATPAELAAVMAVLVGPEDAAGDSALLARMMEAFPDG